MVGTPVRLYGALSFYALSIKEKLNTLPSFNHLSRDKEEEVVEEDARDESCDGIHGVVCLDIYRGEEHQDKQRDDEIEEFSAATMPC